MAAIVGMRGTGSWSSDERPKNYREMILYLYPHGKAVLTALMGKLKEESTDDAEFKVFIKGLPEQRSEVGSGGYDNSTDPIVIPLEGSNENTYFKVGHVIMNEQTAEIMWVTAVGTANQITAKRDVGTSKVAGTQYDGIVIIGSAHEEGADTPAEKMYDPSVVTNYTQIFRNAVSMTRTARQTHLRTGDQIKRAQKECLLLHGIEMEKAFLFGVAQEYTGGTHPKRTTRGMLHHIATNVKDWSDGFTIDNFEDMCEDLFRYGSNSKLWLGGARTINAINKMARVTGNIELVPGAESYGLRIMRYMTPFGELLLKIHPLMSENETFNKWAFVIDTDQLVYRYLKGSDTKYLRNRQGNGIDGVLDEYLTEAGMEARHEKTHAVIKDMDTFIP